MRVAGIDYASSGWSAVALAVDGVPQRAAAWKPDKKLYNEGGKLIALERWLTFQLTVVKPDVIVVGGLANMRGAKTVRALGHAEGICLLVATKKCPVVISKTDKQARAIVYRGVYGGGSISKDAAWEHRGKPFPGFDFGHKTRGGDDKMDAMTFAVAGPDLLQKT